MNNGLGSATRNLTDKASPVGATADDANHVAQHVALRRKSTLRTSDETNPGSPLQRVTVFTAVLCLLCFVEGISVNGLKNINNNSIETRFGLTSKQSGLISSSGELGAISVVLLVSFYGGKSHRPRVCAAGGFVLCLGCCFFLIPHLLIGLYETAGANNEQVACGTDGAGNPECEDKSTKQEEEDSGVKYLPLFLVGQAIQGMGFTPMFTCGFAYIDDHASADMTAVHIGITYAITALGVGVGFIMGGQFLLFWVDIGRTDPDTTVDLEPSDKRWVGAWWMGYAVSACLYVVFSSVMCLFPRFMRGSKTCQRMKDEAALLELELLESTGEDCEKTVEKPKSVWEIISAFPRTLIGLVKNPLYFLMVLVGTGDSLVVSGLSTFAPKIIQEYFNLKPSIAGAIMGSVTLVGGAGGMAMGGFLIRRFHLRLLGIMKLVACNICLAAFFGAGAFFIQCTQGKMSGINYHYGPKDSTDIPVALTGTCNKGCSCTTRHFIPLCGENDIAYMSPCYAGCPANGIKTLENNVKTYNNCRCIIDSLDQTSNGTAKAGICEQSCLALYPFIVFMFFGMMFTFLNVTPISMSIIRCVPTEQRSIGLGLQWLSLRLLATIPGPVLTGAILDRNCDLWEEKCHGVKGNCWLYDRVGMSLGLFIWWAFVKVLSLLFLLIAYFIYTRYGHPEVDRQEKMHRRNTHVSLTISDPHLHDLNNIMTSTERPFESDTVDDGFASVKQTVSSSNDEKMTDSSSIGDLTTAKRSVSSSTDPGRRGTDAMTGTKVTSEDRESVASPVKSILKSQPSTDTQSGTSPSSSMPKSPTSGDRKSVTSLPSNMPKSPPSPDRQSVTSQGSSKPKSSTSEDKKSITSEASKSKLSQPSTDAQSLASPASNKEAGGLPNSNTETTEAVIQDTGNT